MEQLSAFHGDQKIKDFYIDRIRQHREADQLVRGTSVRGTSWDSTTNTGCGIGCTLNAYDHQAYETELGIPELIAHLEDSIFEGLPEADAMEWPGKFLKAIPIGADLTKIIPQIVIWQFEDETWGLQNTQEIKDDPKLAIACTDLVALYRRELAGGRVTTDEWKAIYQGRRWCGRGRGRGRGRRGRGRRRGLGCWH